MSRRIRLQNLAIGFSIVGCLLIVPALRAHKPVTTRYTFYNDVLPILERRCAACHGAGGPAPFSLLDYAEARRWAEAIKEQVIGRGMPPWFAESGYEPLAGENALSARELDALADWASGGARAGERASPLASAATRPPAAPLPGLDSRAYPLETGAGRIRIDLGLEEDRFLASFRLDPPSGVHGAVLRLEAPGRETELIGAWTLAADELPWPEGAGLRLPAGSALALETYRDSLRPLRHAAVDHRGALVLRFLRPGKPREVRQMGLAGERAPPAGGRILAFFPRPGEAGRLLLEAAGAPPETRRIIASTVASGPDWPFVYRFARPIAVPDGSRLRWEARGVAAAAPAAVTVFFLEPR